MSRRTEITCDRCGIEINAINNAQISAKSARLDLYPTGAPRTYPSQRLDLCEQCYEDFVTFLECAHTTEKGGVE